VADDGISIPEWMREIRHQPDPNRVGSLQMPVTHPLERRTPAAQPLPPTPAVATTPTSLRPGGASSAAIQDPSPEPSYYDVSMLKAPVWKWEIASYFFLGGISGGAYILSRLASRLGGDAHRDLAKAGAFTALGTLLPCPPLLIHDLGDPKRFHHMLRIWKPSSPMNVGTWTLTSYSGSATVAAIHEWARSRPAFERSAVRTLLNPAVVAVCDAAGIPLALMLVGYTSVLLSSTSNPLWCKNPWLGPLFSSSAIASGAAACSLALRLGGSDEDSPSLRVLDEVDSVAHAVEAASMVGFVKRAGENAKPLTRGSQARNFRAAGAMMAAAEVVKRLPLRGKARRLAHVASAALSLGSGFALRWSVVHGGLEAANDPHLARNVSRRRPQQGAARGSLPGLSAQPSIGPANALPPARPQPPATP
jgi:formate-dependent nitrite reductase membrane component NrfD